MDTQETKDLQYMLKVNEETVNKQNVMLEKSNQSLAEMSESTVHVAKKLIETSEVIKNSTSDFNKAKDDLTKLDNSIVDLTNKIENKNREISEYGDKLKEIITSIQKYEDLNSKNKEDLTNKLTELYVGYTEKVIKLIGEINEIKDKISKVNYKEDVLEMISKLTEYKNTVFDLQKVNTGDVNLILEKVESLTKEIKELKDELDKTNKFNVDFAKNMEDITSKIKLIEIKVDSITEENSNEETAEVK